LVAGGFAGRLISKTERRFEVPPGWVFHVGARGDPAAASVAFCPLVVSFPGERHAARRERLGRRHNVVGVP
jgi:hypothetical protein